MNLLVLDTSGPVCGVAVLDGARVLSEYAARNRYTHSTSLMPMVERSLESAGRTLAEMDALAVVTGPGSFTGVRIGVATVKGLAHGSGKPCIPVDALEALVWSTGRPDWDGLILPMQDARAGQVYGAVFRGRERLTENVPVRLEELLAQAKGMTGGKLLVTGDGAEAHREKIRELLGDIAVFPEPEFAYLRPACAGRIALEKGQAVDYLHLRETYLRPPNAEKNKKLLEAMRHE